jgi:AraC-like DNA-binding protein
MAAAQETQVAIPPTDWATAPPRFSVRRSRDIFEFAGASLWMEGECCPPAASSRQVVGIVQVAGASTIQQHGRSATLHPGQFALVDPSRSFTMVHLSDFQQLHLFLPAPHFSSRELANAAVRLADRREMVDEIFVRCLVGVWNAAPALSFDQQAPTANALHSLLSITTPFQSSAELTQIDVRVLRALEFIEGRLCSEFLTAGAVSDAQKLSRRRLDDLFLKSVGLRVERWIWERRLSRAEQALRAPRFGSRSLLQLALDLGFKSPSHFSRAFANRFGVAPREYRRKYQTLTGAPDCQSMKGNGTQTTPLPA